jgi:hypothetical protein
MSLVIFSNCYRVRRADTLGLGYAHFGAHRTLTAPSRRS